MDAANLLKPALARGELRCIGATTLAEYRQHIEKDAAFERRFQQVRQLPVKWSCVLQTEHVHPCPSSGYCGFHCYMQSNMTGTPPVAGTNEDEHMSVPHSCFWKFCRATGLTPPSHVMSSYPQYCVPATMPLGYLILHLCAAGHGGGAQRGRHDQHPAWPVRALLRLPWRAHCRPVSL